MSFLGWTNLGTAILFAVSLGFGFYERAGWEGEIASRAQAFAIAQATVLKAQQEDAAATRVLEDAHAAKIATLKEQANARALSIAQVPATHACASSPAMRALFDGLRPKLSPAGLDEAGTTRGTRPPLSR